MKDLSETPLNSLLSKQSILLGFLEEKLKISNFLNWGFKTELPILESNSFLHFTSHMCLRSAIIDVCALFDNHKFQSNNFYLLIDTKKKFLLELEVQCLLEIKTELERAERLMQPLRKARNEDIAHYRFEQPKISLTHELLTTLNRLYSYGIEIFDIAMWGRKVKENQIWFSIGSFYDDGSQSDNLISLQRLLKKTNQFDYKKAWEEHQKKGRWWITLWSNPRSYFDGMPNEQNE